MAFMPLPNTEGYLTDFVLPIFDGSACQLRPLADKTPGARGIPAIPHRETGPAHCRPTGTREAIALPAPNRRRKFGKQRNIASWVREGLRCRPPIYAFLPPQQVVVPRQTAAPGLERVDRG